MVCVIQSLMFRVLAAASTDTCRCRPGTRGDSPAGDAAGLNTVLGAPAQVVGNGPVELAPQAIYVGGLEGNFRTGGRIDDLSMKHSDRFFVLDIGDVSLVLYHGRTHTVARYMPIDRNVTLPPSG